MTLPRRSFLGSLLATPLILRAPEFGRLVPVTRIVPELMLVDFGLGTQWELPTDGDIFADMARAVFLLPMYSLRNQTVYFVASKAARTTMGARLVRDRNAISSAVLWDRRIPLDELMRSFRAIPVLSA